MHENVSRLLRIMKAVELLTSTLSELGLREEDAKRVLDDNGQINLYEHRVRGSQFQGRDGELELGWTFLITADTAASLICHLDVLDSSYKQGHKAILELTYGQAEPGWQLEAEDENHPKFLEIFTQHKQFLDQLFIVPLLETQVRQILQLFASFI